MTITHNTMIMDQINQIRLANYKLVKCAKCGKEITFEQKSIRQKNDWFHANCFKIMAPEKSKQQQNTTNLEPVYKTTTISERIYQQKQKMQSSQTKHTLPHSVEQKPIKKEQPIQTAKPKPTPPLVQKPNTKT